MKHVIMANENERVMAVIEEDGEYVPAVLVREFFAPSVEMDAQIKPVRVDIDDLTNAELEQYNNLLRKVIEAV